VAYDAQPITHGMARVLRPYALSNTKFFSENGVLRGVLQETVEEATLSERGIETVTLLSEWGTSATPVPSDTWGATRFRLDDVLQSRRREETPGSSY